MVLDTRILLLKDLDAIKTYFAALDIKNAGEQEEQVNKFTRRINQLIWRNDFSRLQEEYMDLEEIHSMFNSKMKDLIMLLDTDEEGNHKIPSKWDA